MNISKKAVAIGVGLVLGIGGTTVAVAAIPDSTTGVFTACVANGSGNVRIIDEEGGASCHSYETEKSWDGSGAGDPFAPDLHVDFQDQKLTEFGGTTLTRTYNCPSGEKLVAARAGERVGGHNTSDYPGYADVSSGGNEVPVYQYVETSGVVTGFKIKHVEPSWAVSVAYTCSA